MEAAARICRGRTINALRRRQNDRRQSLRQLAVIEEGWRQINYPEGPGNFTVIRTGGEMEVNGGGAAGSAVVISGGALRMSPGGRTVRTVFISWWRLAEESIGVAKSILKSRGTIQRP
jgi:hypothetical protein